MKCQQTPKHAEALSKAAQKAIDLEEQKSKIDSESTVGDVVLSVSKLLEKSYTNVNQLIQDSPGRSDNWKTAALDRLDEASAH